MNSEDSESRERYLLSFGYAKADQRDSGKPANDLTRGRGGAEQRTGTAYLALRTAAQAPTKRSRQSGSGVQGKLEACLRDKAKLQRAYGECLGSPRRRRTWTAAISHGEALTAKDPWISEWGNPHGEDHGAYGEYISVGGERRELKHLSTCRRRKKPRFPQ